MNAEIPLSTIVVSPNHLSEIAKYAGVNRPEDVTVQTVIDAPGDRILYELEKEVAQSSLSEYAAIMPDVPGLEEDFAAIQERRHMWVDFIHNLLSSGAAVWNSSYIQNIISHIRNEFQYLHPQTKDLLRQLIETFDPQSEKNLPAAA